MRRDHYGRPWGIRRRALSILVVSLIASAVLPAIALVGLRDAAGRAVNRAVDRVRLTAPENAIDAAKQGCPRSQHRMRTAATIGP